MHATDAASAAPGRMPLQAWSADVFAKRDVAPPDPVLAPVLVRGAITLLTGPRGVGKSWLALAMADAAARGRALAGWRARACRAVYVDAASGEALLRTRLAALAPAKPSPDLILVPGDAQVSGLPDLASESGRAALDQLVTGADLVVLDGLTALVQLGRGVGAHWAALMDWLRALRRRGIAVLLVDAVEPRALAALADTVLRLERPADRAAHDGVRCQVRVTASRAMADETCRRFELRLAFRKGRAVWTRLDDIDHRALVAWRLSEGGYSTREIARKLDVSPATAWRLAERGEAMPARLRDAAELPALDAEEQARAAAERRQDAADRRAAVRRSQRLVTAMLRHDPHPMPCAGRGRSAPQDEGGQGEEAASAAMKPDKAPPTANSPEAVKHPPQPHAPPPLTRAERLWRTPISRLPITGGAP